MMEPNVSGRFSSLFLLPFLLLAGCAATTEQGVIKEGGVRLSAKEIYALTADNTLKVDSQNFKANIFFNKNGRLSAKNQVNSSTDIGRWDITSDDQLCHKYRVWYHGDTLCHSIYKTTAGDRYLFINSNGLIDFTGSPMSGDPLELAKAITQKGSTTFLRQELAAGEQAAPSEPAASPSTQQESSGSDSSDLSKKDTENNVKILAKDCPGCTLKDSDLRQADLVGAKLQGANLKRANLSRANLRRANLEEANLSNANLRSANLPGANLKGADLSDADLTGANLLKADLSGADIDGANFSNAHLDGVKGLPGQP
jgi:uncharacterized protein YjbI with pentapeptide repeats